VEGADGSETSLDILTVKILTPDTCSAESVLDNFGKTEPSDDRVLRLHALSKFQKSIFKRGTLVLLLKVPNLQRQCLLRSDLKFL